MSKRETFLVRTLGVVMLDGRRFLPNTTIALTPVAALTLVREGRARLLDSADVAVLAETAANWKHGPQER